MNAWLSAAGRAFFRSFAGSLIILLPGVLAASNLDGMYALGVAALLSSLAGAIGVLADYVQYLTLTYWLEKIGLGWLGPYADTALRTFVSACLVFLPGVLNAPDWNGAKAAFVAGLIGAASAAARAVADVFTKGEGPFPGFGWGGTGDAPAGGVGK